MSEKSVRGRKLWVLAVLAGIVVGAAAGCDDAGITTPDRDPTFLGILVGLNGCDFTEVCPLVIPGVVETAWVKNDLEDPCGVILTVDEDTELLLREGSALRRAAPADFTPFRDVAAWVVGDVVAESCPAQGLAESIELR